jgi:protein involved in polysaccharide export with SLBB domain
LPILLIAMRSSSLLLTAFAGLLFPACSTVKNVVSHIPLPNLKMPSMRDVAKLIPGMPESDQVDANDPEVPFNSRNPLQTGHTLRLEVYEGSRDPSRVFRGIVMVDDSGNILLGEAGYAKVGGKRLPQAAEAITAVFRVRAYTSRPVTVHIFSVENTPVIGINGDVQTAEYLPAFEDITVKQAVVVTGGRRLKSTARGVYIARDGQRRFFTSLDHADEDWNLRAGDVITLSPDI